MWFKEKNNVMSSFGGSSKVGSTHQKPKTLLKNLWTVPEPRHMPMLLSWDKNRWTLQWTVGFRSMLTVKEAETFSPLGLTATGFITNFYMLKVQSHGFALQSWSFSVVHFGKGETGGCLVFELFEGPSTAVTLQMSTSCSVEISPHIGPLCTFTSTQPYSTLLNFILRRGPLKGCIAPFVNAVLLIKIAA